MEKIDLSCKTQRPLKKESNKQSRFIDLTHDYGFKIVMADENHPELMLGFLNAIIPERKIVSISFLNTEQLPTVEEHHRVNYDVLCIDSQGNRFITEMQKEPYSRFADRLIVYAGGQASHLLERGKPYTEVQALYVISILGGRLQIEGETDADRNSLVRRARVTMQSTQKVLSDKLNFIFLQLPVAKKPNASATFIEKWAWYVRKMVSFKTKPEGLDNYFNLLFDASNRDNIEQGKLSIYDKMVRDEIQIAAEREYAVNEARIAALAEGRAEGHAEGQYEANLAVAEKLKLAGADIELISQCTGLSVEEINAL